ncbi:hypothetical protein [Metabacillus bambusae]|uniref:Transcriptional regulator n=1 Tax=Metabacillus bambusae TaxID=2795218 RepID=A0ABS3N4K6_9BACI|nr:hypothetical protein [Metabacillus bambusae]MBO1513246.1 hypothetical protein [Metabacillus bambusae]
MIGKVKVWYMTEEERLAYIEKHPIKETARPKGSTYVNAAFEMTNMPRKKKNK